MDSNRATGTYVFFFMLRVFDPSFFSPSIVGRRLCFQPAALLLQGHPAFLRDVSPFVNKLPNVDDHLALHIRGFIGCAYPACPPWQELSVFSCLSTASRPSYEFWQAGGQPSKIGGS